MTSIELKTKSLMYIKEEHRLSKIIILFKILLREKDDSYTPNFFGFPKDGFAFFHFPNIEQVRVQFFVVVIYLEECTPVCIHQVFCIYLQNNIGDRGLLATLRSWKNRKNMENYV